MINIATHAPIIIFYYFSILTHLTSSLSLSVSPFTYPSFTPIPSPSLYSPTLFYLSSHSVILPLSTHYLSTHILSSFHFPLSLNLSPLTHPFLLTPSLTPHLSFVYSLTPSYSLPYTYPLPTIHSSFLYSLSILSHCFLSVFLPMPH